MINKKEKKCRYCKMFKGCSLINDSDNIIENYAEQCDYYCVEEKEVNLKKYSQKEKDDFINESCKVLNNIGERDTERIIKNPDENAKFLNGGICDMSKFVTPSKQEVKCGNIIRTKQGIMLVEKIKKDGTLLGHEIKRHISFWTSDVDKDIEILNSEFTYKKELLVNLKKELDKILNQFHGGIHPKCNICKIEEKMNEVFGQVLG